jgi:hypothetical protein
VAFIVLGARQVIPVEDTILMVLIVVGTIYVLGALPLTVISQKETPNHHVMIIVLVILDIIMETHHVQTVDGVAVPTQQKTVMHMIGVTLMEVAVRKGIIIAAVLMLVVNIQSQTDIQIVLVLMQGVLLINVK